MKNNHYSQSCNRVTIPSSKSTWYRQSDQLIATLRQSHNDGSQSTPDIAGYSDLVELAQGGQGIVFSAIQKSTSRRVAIKVLSRAASTSEDAPLRFQNEIDLIASLRHPNIVRVYDSGSDAHDRLYLVMELINGCKLHHWSKMHGIGRHHEIARLFVQIADALQSAHQRGIIHRDLKPSNVLVDEEGRPHLLDFGIAMLMTDVEGERSGFTGSLPWASPEQTRGNPLFVDVRSDIYSLGVMLYACCTGERPYSISLDFRESIKTINESPPDQDLMRRAHMPRDLQSIALKCLCKDVDDRYQSAEHLSHDLRQFLSHRPISAKRSSVRYRLGRFIRRNPALTAAMTAAIIFFLLGFVAAFNGYLRTAAERDRLAAMNEFFSEMLLTINPIHTNRKVTIKDLLDVAGSQIDSRFPDDPLIRADLHAKIGSSYKLLGMWNSKLHHLRSALELYRQHLDGPDIRLAEVLVHVALFDSASLEDALLLADRALEIAKAVDADDRSTIFEYETNRIRVMLAHQYDETVLPELNRLIDEGHTDGITIEQHLYLIVARSGLSMFMDDFEQVQTDLDYLMDLEHLLNDPDHRFIITRLSYQAALHIEDGEFEQAEQLLEDSLAKQRIALPIAHPSYVMNWLRRVELAIARDDLKDAAGVLEQISDVYLNSEDPIPSLVERIEELRDEIVTSQ